MNERIKELMHHLSTTSCQRVLECLEEGLDHPDDISKTMGVVRQTVDWHLLKLSALGIVERVPVSSISGRPKITYRLSDDGKQLIGDIEELMKAHITKLGQRYEGARRELDIRLARGEISERAYKENLRRLKKEMDFIGWKMD